MKNKHLREAIIDIVQKSNDMITFNKLCEQVEGFSGDQYYKVKEFPNRVLWHKMSQEAIDIVEELQENSVIFLWPAEDEFYSGKDHPNLPFASFMDGGLIDNDNLQWIPMVFFREPY